MTGDGTKRDELEIGIMVEINPREDRTRKQRITGFIAEILTGSAFHSHGILVRLKSGEIGRIKNILKNMPVELEQKESILNESHDSQPVEDIISKGENHFVEFKSSMLWSERLTPDQIKKHRSNDVQRYKQRASKLVIARTIAGFLNADGGDLFIGIKENKDTMNDEIIGIESEFSKLKDPCTDGYRRKILDDIIKIYFPSFIFNHFNNYLTIEFVCIDDKVICWVHITKSDKQVFLRIQNKGCFFVRVDASVRQILGEDIVDYCMKRFN